MNQHLIAKTTITVNATAKEVWKALTTPSIIKQYLMGTNAVSDWKEGSTITYTGEWEGKKYEDKGKIIKLDPGKVFQSTYLSGMSGKEDKPENYNLVTYRLKEKDSKTQITLTQDNNATEKDKEHSISNWKMVLKKLKEVIEKKI